MIGAGVWWSYHTDKMDDVKLDCGLLLLHVATMV